MNTERFLLERVRDRVIAARITLCSLFEGDDGVMPGLAAYSVLPQLLQAMDRELGINALVLEEAFDRAA